METPALGLTLALLALALDPKIQGPDSGTSFGHFQNTQ
jgi:hypothetical protein